MPDQANRDVANFENFELRNIEWMEGRAEYRIAYGGENLVLKAERSWGNVMGTDISWRYKFSITSVDPTKQEILIETINPVRPNPQKDPVVHITTLIRKFHPLENMEPQRLTQRELPRGLGRLLYKKCHEYIRFLGNKNDVTIRHRIVKEPSEYRTSSEDWDRFFMPLIEKEAYQRVEGEEDDDRPAWERTYEPQHGNH